MDPTSAPRRLPPELTDKIIDELAISLEDEPQPFRAALRTCSLVCRDWLPRSRTHLFFLGSLQNGKTCRAFCNLLESSPGIGEHVRVLRITETPRAVCGEWVDSTLPCLRSELLPNIHTLRIQALQWDKLSAPTMTYLYSRFAVVKKLQLCLGCLPGVHAFHELLYALPLLECLSSICMRNMSNDSGTDEPSINTRRVRLRSIRLDSNRAPLSRWLVSGRMVPCIEALDVCHHSFHNDDGLRRLFHFAGDSLKRLKIGVDIGRNSDPFITSAVLHDAFSGLIAPSLVFLRINITVGPRNHKLPWVFAVISQVPRGHLEDIEFDVDDIDAVHVRDQVDWESIDILLADDASSRARVTFYISGEDIEGVGTWNALKSRMPSLSQRRALFRSFYRTGEGRTRLFC